MAASSSNNPSPTLSSDLIFPYQSLNINLITSSLKKSAFTIKNRLHAIDKDASFVRDHAEKICDYPVIANERCGSWYVPPDCKAGSGYFKSTDGHTRQWKFSLKRLNLHLLEIIGKFGGLIIVDSTRQGKCMPDAFTRTIPIWCAVLNRALFPQIPYVRKLRSIPLLVSESEIAQMDAKVDEFVEAFKTLELDLDSLRACLKRPILPYWVSPALNYQDFNESLQTSDKVDYNMICLLMPSEYQRSASPGSYSSYIQGAGDDSETWAHGLTPSLYFAHKDLLLSTSEDELPELIQALVHDPANHKSGLPLTKIDKFPQLYVGAYDNVFETAESSLTIVCAPSNKVRIEVKNNGRFLHLLCRVGKLGSRDLRSQLQKLPHFIQHAPTSDLQSIRVFCIDGKDTAIGVVLAIICLYCDGEGTIQNHHTNTNIDKKLIRRNLAMLMAALPFASPSRTTLNAVNSFLMKQPP